MKRWLLAACALLAACGNPPGPVDRAPPPSLSTSQLDALEPRVGAALGGAHQAWQRAHAQSPDGDTAVAAAADFGRLALAYERHDWAQQAFTWASQRRPEDYRWHYLLARSALGLGEVEPALTGLRETLRLQPGYLPARLVLAERLLERNALDEAGQALGEPAPDESPAVLGLRGRLALAAGDHGRAADLLERALRREPEASRLRYPLGLALRGLGREEEARGQMAQRGQVAPRLEDPLMAAVERLADGAQSLRARAATVAASGDFAGAIRLYDESLAAEEDLLTRLNLAIALARSGADARAEAEYLRVLEVDPGLAVAHFGLGTLLAGRGSHEEALAAYRRALDLRPGDDDARFNLANTLRRLGRLAEAEREYTEVSRRDPSRVVASIARSQVQAEQRRWAEAVATLSSALEAHPADARVALSLARLLAGAPDPAVRDGSTALRLAERLFTQERSLPHGEALAMALAEAGRTPEAAALQQQLIESAIAQGRRDLAEGLQPALATYRRGEPWRLE